MWLAAERASISRSTLTKVEKGDEGVSMVAYAKVLFILGMIQHVAEWADATRDTLGMDLEAENLPKRIRLPRRKG